MSTLKNVSPIGRDLPPGATVPPGGLIHDVDLDADTVDPEIARALKHGWFIEVPDKPTREELIALIATLDDATALDHHEQAEQARPEPRKTVLDAIAKRRPHLDTTKEQTS